MTSLTPTVMCGDARRIPLDDGSVHCVVTSPPYFGLRAYGGDPGMIGLGADVRRSPGEPCGSCSARFGGCCGTMARFF